MGHLAKLLVVGMLTASCALAQQKDEQLIPPEVLNQMDPDIRSGKRPRITSITQDGIFGLRNNPKFDADFVTFGFDPSSLSSVQRQIVADWARAGHNRIYLADKQIVTYASFVSATAADAIGTGSPKYHLGCYANGLAKHAVNTDCTQISFGRRFGDGRYTRDDDDEYGYSYFAGLPPESSIIVEGKPGAVCGSFPVGNGRVYFKDSIEGTDSRRWHLNFWHWAMGLGVPGAADTSTNGGPTGSVTLVEKEKHDSIGLKNGDTLTGDILNVSVKLKTSYTSVELKLKEVAKINFEGGTDNVDTLQLVTGDRLSGVVETDTFKVKLVAGNEIELKRDKIKQIELRKRRE